MEQGRFLGFSGEQGVHDLFDGRQRFGPSCRGVALALLLVVAPSAVAFDLQTRWSQTAISGSGLQVGDPTTITWGFVADGTPVIGNEGNSPSSLIATLDSLYPNGGTGSDLTNREWFLLFEQAFERLSQLAGLTYIYEPNNSGAAIDSTAGPQGAVGQVPDVRIGGHSIDGDAGTNTLAYSYYPNHSDIVIDTDNVSWLGNRANNSRRLRNLLMHEQGHGLGLKHVDMPGMALLDDVLVTNFDGPQLDDILGLQRLYGDALEKNGGNDTHLTATALGGLGASPLRIGTLGDTVAVAPTDVDFVSIDGSTDTDYYSFTLSVPAIVSLSLTPRGAVYNIGGSSFNARVLNDLALTLFDSSGTTELASAAISGAGVPELIEGIYLATPGTYFARVTGFVDQVQLYGLDITADALFLQGDVNLDGVISTGSGDPATDDIAAFVAGWQTVLPSDDLVTAWRKGDLDLNGVSDLHDAFRLRQALAGAGLSFNLNLLAPVPEPATCAVAVTALLLVGGCRPPRKTRGT